MNMAEAQGNQSGCQSAPAETAAEPLPARSSDCHGETRTDAKSGRLWTARGPGVDRLAIGSLFSGIDGLALGVQLVTGGHVAWHCELAADASTVLGRHWLAPNLGDITRVDWSRAEPVDVMVGGFPCQDVSLAGKGGGVEHGERSGLWREFVRAIRALRPRFVFVENVSALLARGFDIVVGDLVESGYRVAWSSIRSADVGAPHRRERVFILASADSDRDGGRERLAAEHGAHGGLDEQLRNDAHRRRTGAREVPRSDRAMGADPRQKGAADGRLKLNPEFVEWMMGFPPGWTHGVTRSARLRLLGNAVQPQVAAAAFVGLARVLEVTP